MTTTQPFEQFSAEITQQLAAANVPGAVFGIIADGETHIQPFGVTNLDHPLDVTPDTLFQIGSITKTYTALALLRLVADGKLDLDQPVRDHLPDFRVADDATSHAVTVRHLLAHTSGWVGDIFLNIDSSERALASYTAALDDVPQVAPLGTLFSYNNSGFSIAGRIIEVITGKVYEQAMAELIFEPLGLTNSYFFSHEVITRRFSVGHAELPEGPKVQRPWDVPRTLIAAGAIACGIEDLLTYASFYWDEGQSLVPTELVSEMTTPQVPIFEATSMGLSWFIHEVDGVKVIQHGGRTMGQNALLIVVPARRFAFAMLANCGSVSQTMDAAARQALRDWVDVTLPSAEPSAESAEIRQKFIGHYTRPAVAIDIYEADDQLFARITSESLFEVESEEPDPPPIPLCVCGEHQLKCTEGTYKGSVFTWLTTDDGVTWMRVGQRVHRKARETAS